MKAQILIMSLIAIGCRSGEPASGTSVGNPGKLRPTIGEGENVAIFWSQGSVDSVELEGCGGESIEVLVEDETLFDGTTEIEIPAGQYCSVQLVMERPLEIKASFEVEREETEEWSFTMYLPFEDQILVGSETGFAVDGGSYVLEIGEPGWLDIEDLGDLEDEEILKEDDEISIWAAQIAAGTTALWEDDGDGILDEEEREAEPVSRASFERDEEDEEDEEDEKEPTEDEAGCATASPPSATWVAWMISLLVLVRRRIG